MIMINLLILITLNSLLCNGLYNAFQFESTETGIPDSKTKGIFWFWKYYILDEINYRVSKPLGNCLTCMASVYSFIPYFGYFGFEPQAIVFYPGYVLALAGLNNVISKIGNE